MIDVEERVHLWFLKNQDKTQAQKGHWWNVNNEFLKEMLKETSIPLLDYQDFFQRKSEENELVPTGSGE